METKMMSISKVSIVKALSIITMVAVLALGIISNISISASAQDSNTTYISIVSGAFRLTDMAYQPNPINIKVGDSVIWTNDDSSTHTVTLKDQPGTDDDRSDDDNSELGIIEKIREELVSNIITNIRNTLSDLGAIGQASETTDICSSQQPSTSPIEFDSGIMQAGQTFKHTFYEAGTFEYYCAVHSAMVGKIVVS